jgi:hypothetical protein
LAINWTAWFTTFLHGWLSYFAHAVAPLIFLVLFFPAQRKTAPKRAGKISKLA